MLEFLEDAAIELELAVTWHDTQRPGLGAEFLDALRATVTHAEDTPGIGKLEQDAPKRFDMRWYTTAEHQLPELVKIASEVSRAERDDPTVNLHDEEEESSSEPGTATLVGDHLASPHMSSGPGTESRSKRSRRPCCGRSVPARLSEPLIDHL